VSALRAWTQFGVIAHSEAFEHLHRPLDRGGSDGRFDLVGHTQAYYGAGRAGCATKRLPRSAGLKRPPS
jgi:hypothetical protein